MPPAVLSKVNTSLLSGDSSLGPSDATWLLDPSNSHSIDQLLVSSVVTCKTALVISDATSGVVQSHTSLALRLATDKT